MSLTFELIEMGGFPVLSVSIKPGADGAAGPKFVFLASVGLSSLGTILKDCSQKNITVSKIDHNHVLINTPQHEEGKHIPFYSVQKTNMLVLFCLFYPVNCLKIPI